MSIIVNNQGEFICMKETVGNTQKLIRTWVSSGYSINIVAQSIFRQPEISDHTIVVTSLWRIK